MSLRRSLVIFGTGPIGELAHYYFTHDSHYDVLGFTVDSAYLEQDSFCGLPVVPFETVEERYSPDTCDMFVALSYSKLNQIRKEKYVSAKSKGYAIASYISTHATVLNDGRIGENCFILEDNTIQPFVTIGNNVTLWSGNHIGHHSSIEDHCFLASHIVVSGGVTIRQSTFVGVNATLRDHITIGQSNVIGAGAVIMSDTQDGQVYIAQKTEAHALPSHKLKGL